MNELPTEQLLAARRVCVQRAQPARRARADPDVVMINENISCTAEGKFMRLGALRPA
jgi:F420-0:gamma-glutamyl ligase